MNKQPDLIYSWETLKQQLTERYQPIAQEQISFSKLLKVRFKTSINALNYEFLKYLQLLPQFNQSADESVIMGIYMNALTEAQGTTYICTNLRDAIANKKVTTLAQLQSMALLAESNLGKSNKTNVPYISHHSRPSHSSSSSSSSQAYSSNRFSRPPFRPHSSSSFQRHGPSVSSPSFQTPAKLNNVQGGAASGNGKAWKCGWKCGRKW